jgi:RimJ/RimL family protein N-acetyltransferase
MFQINPNQITALKDWFIPESPCWLVGMHILNTGNGACFLDRWPVPQAVLLDSGGNYSLLGDTDALQPEDLKVRIHGFLDAPAQFEPLLKETFPDLKAWDRIILELLEKPHLSRPDGYMFRRLEAGDSYHLWGLTPESAWITKTWGGPAGLAASGHAWGAFAQGQLVAVAATWFLGEEHEELGVVTEAAYRGRGLSAACAGALCADIQNRGHQPTWSTSPDNDASVRVAEKIGFSILRGARLYVIGTPIPDPPSNADLVG